MSARQVGVLWLLVLSILLTAWALEQPRIVFKNIYPDAKGVYETCGPGEG